MQKIYKENINMWELGTDVNHILHRIGTDAQTPIRRIIVKPEEVENWEEVDYADVPSYSKADYDAEVERLIAKRYSLGKEIEINRESQTKPDLYAEYLAYIEECKNQARENLMN